MKRYLLIALMLLAGPLSADPVRVQSGEHKDFTRLVFYFDEKPDFRLGRVPEGYELRVAGEGLSYRLDRVFDVIPRKRLTDMRQRDSGLLLATDCDCHAETFFVRPEILVVDLKSGPARDDSPYEVAFAEPAPRGAYIPAQDDALVPLSLLASPDRLSLRPRATAPAAAPVPIVRAARGERPAPSPVQPDLDALRANLAEQIGRALSYGLAEPRDGDHRPQRMRDPSADGVHVSPQVDVSTAFDAVLPQGRSRAVLSCAPDALFRVGDWGGDAKPFDIIAERRAALAGDGKTTATEAILSLARAYVHLGFGAEARDTLRDLPDGIANARFLPDLARLVDTPLAGASPGLRDQAGCETAAAMWGILAGGPDEAGVSMATKSAVRSFSSLPPWLRQQVGPALADRLRIDGHGADAQAVLNAIDRAAGGVSEIAGREGDTAEPRLGQPQRDSAIAGMIARLGQTTPAPDAQTISEAASLIHEFKGTPESAELLRAYVGAQLDRQNYGAAMKSIHQLRDSDYSRSYPLDGLMAEVLARMAARARDGEFVTMLAGLSASDLPRDMDQGLKQSLADRLMALDFPEEARRLLPDVHSNRPAAVVAAETAKVDAVPDEAIVKPAPAEEEVAETPAAPAPTMPEGAPSLASLEAMLAKSQGLRRDITALVGAR